MGAKPQGVWGTKSPEAEAFLSKFYALLVVFHTFSPTYAYFSRACRHHSTKSAKWGGGI